MTKADLIKAANGLKDAASIVLTEIDAYADAGVMLDANTIVKYVSTDKLRLAIADVEEALNKMSLGDADCGKEGSQE